MESDALKKEAEYPPPSTGLIFNGQDYREITPQLKKLKGVFNLHIRCLVLVR
jgi:hypothetical protein